MLAVPSLIAPWLATWKRKHHVFLSHHHCCSLQHARAPSRARASPPLHCVTRPLDGFPGRAVRMCCDDETEKMVWVESSELVEVPLPSTAERFLAVPTDISGVLNTSPTESQGICSHYVKRGLRAPFLGERLPGDLSSSILHELLFKIKIPAVYVKPYMGKCRQLCLRREVVNMPKNETKNPHSAGQSHLNVRR
jgi:hypothetical protein